MEELIKAYRDWQEWEEELKSRRAEKDRIFAEYLIVSNTDSIYDVVYDSLPEDVQKVWDNFCEGVANREFYFKEFMNIMNELAFGEKDGWVCS